MPSIKTFHPTTGSASNHNLLTNENRQNFPKRNILKYFFNWSAHQIILFSQMKTDKLFQNEISWNFSSTTSQSGLRLFWHGQTDSQLNILLLLCLYICSTYYVWYVEYKYRSGRKLDLMDTSNPPQATATINVDWT